MSVDSTVKEKNITFPTDAKLHKKIIDKFVSKAQKGDVVLRRSYKRTSKQLLRQAYNSTHLKRRKKVKASIRQLKTVAGRLVRELERKLPSGEFTTELELFKKVLDQKKGSKNKIYSFMSQRSIASARVRLIQSMNLNARLLRSHPEHRDYCWCYEL